MNEMKILTWHIASLSMVLWLWRLVFRDTTWWADTLSVETGVAAICVLL